MTSRGPATIEVSAGLVEVLGCPWVAAHATAVSPHELVVLRELDGADDVQAFILNCWDKGYEQAVIDLDDVNWFDDAALIAAAPHASWQAFLGTDTEQPGLWLGYTPTTGLVEASHVDHDVMIPVDWANPGTRTEVESAHLTRITAVRATLAQTQQARGGGAASTALHSLHPRMTTPATPIAGVVPTGTPTPRGRGVSR